MEEKNNEQPVSTKPNKSKKGLIIGIIVALLLVVLIAVVLILVLGNGDKKETNGEEKKIETKKEIKESAFRMSGNGLENFDLYFLQLENKEENKIYSPLSIKYALAMLNEGTKGYSKEQITNVIGEYKAKKYTNSKNMSFANAFFVRDSFKDSIVDEFTNNLKDKYGAEVIYDSFESPETVNKWVSNKTLNLIKKLLDKIDERVQFMIINALAIDMEWINSFIADYNANYKMFVIYDHENFSWFGAERVEKGKFENVSEDIATMDIIASFNKYDIVKELGEDNIRKTVGDEYRKFLKENHTELSSSEMETEIETYLNNYIKEINNNYKRDEKTTDFSYYVNDDVKVFAKDLKTYDGLTLQYVAFMPTQEKLTSFVQNATADKLNVLISNLKEAKFENAKDGVVTKIVGNIPKFKFEYSLDLMTDLKSLGITDIFDIEEADLSGLTTSKEIVIGEAIHKANIEFTQDGIKAAAATMMGGLGNAMEFDYLYDVPVEEIDLTFNKPYMFLIRDKDTGEVWFAGTVYTPSLWKNDPDYFQSY